MEPCRCCCWTTAGQLHTSIPPSPSLLCCSQGASLLPALTLARVREASAAPAPAGPPGSCSWGFCGREGGLSMCVRSVFTTKTLSALATIFFSSVNTLYTSCAPAPFPQTAPDRGREGPRGRAGGNGRPSCTCSRRTEGTLHHLFSCVCCLQLAYPQALRPSPFCEREVGRERAGGGVRGETSGSLPSPDFIPVRTSQPAH